MEIKPKADHAISAYKEILFQLDWFGKKNLLERLLQAQVLRDAHSLSVLEYDQLIDYVSNDYFHNNKPK